MKKQALIIGLGQFGMAAAKSLSELGVEVLAVDKSQRRVSIAAEFVTEAVRFDATDEQALLKTAPKNRDVCICAIGDESRESSILCTALLRQMGAKKVFARGNDPLHERILRSIGAHEVINPEAEFGSRIAAHLVYEDVVGIVTMGRGMAFGELHLPPSFEGKTLIDLALPRRFGVTVAAIERQGKTTVAPNPQMPLEKDDVLVVISQKENIVKLMEESV
ncbi:MAG: TrkA family potassium uptake protein [Myxococcales bacterium]|nr:MAG: TrkA family potassium uptake protein [Myxococcales bacterium]